MRHLKSSMALRRMAVRTCWPIGIGPLLNAIISVINKPRFRIYVICYNYTAVSISKQTAWLFKRILSVSVRNAWLLGQSTRLTGTASAFSASNVSKDKDRVDRVAISLFGPSLLSSRKRCTCLCHLISCGKMQHGG